eukprot:GHVL01035478.1.p1 GENE.GHVL01035478.1~~GHVL01035478.1.p1  ORF type:complete len:581 (-),score=77.05 GHVL01035478.1:74-1816(-)
MPVAKLIKKVEEAWLWQKTRGTPNFIKNSKLKSRSLENRTDTPTGGKTTPLVKNICYTPRASCNLTTKSDDSTRRGSLGKNKQNYYDDFHTLFRTIADRCKAGSVTRIPKLNSHFEPTLNDDEVSIKKVVKSLNFRIKNLEKGGRLGDILLYLIKSSIPAHVITYPDPETLIYPFLYAIQFADEDLIRDFCWRIEHTGDSRAVSNLRTIDSETILHVVIRRPPPISNGLRKAGFVASSADLLSFILEMFPVLRLVVNECDSKGQTPLHAASFFGNVRTVQMLLHVGADPNLRENSAGWTPLHFAVSQAHHGVILQLLYNPKTDVDKTDRFNWPCLYEAVSSFDKKSIGLLLNGGANPCYSTRSGLSLLNSFDKKSSETQWLSRYLVSNGVDIRQMTDKTDFYDIDMAYYKSRSKGVNRPSIYTSEHLTTQCQDCTAVLKNKHWCRICGAILCERCAKTRVLRIQPLDLAMLPLRQSKQNSQIRYVSRYPTPKPLSDDTEDIDLSSCDGLDIEEQLLNDAVDMTLRGHSSSFCQRAFTENNFLTDDESYGGKNSDIRSSNSRFPSKICRGCLKFHDTAASL